MLRAEDMKGKVGYIHVVIHLSLVLRRICVHQNPHQRCLFLLNKKWYDNPPQSSSYWRHEKVYAWSCWRYERKGSYIHVDIWFDWSRFIVTVHCHPKLWSIFLTCDANKFIKLKVNIPKTHKKVYASRYEGKGWLNLEHLDPQWPRGLDSKTFTLFYSENDFDVSDEQKSTSNNKVKRTPSQVLRRTQVLSSSRSNPNWKRIKGKSPGR